MGFEHRAAVAGRRSKTPRDGGKHRLRAAKLDERQATSAYLCFNSYMAGAREYFPILKDRVRARQFNSLFLFVTSRCNSLCRTCFYFDKLNSKTT